ncbi:MAG: wax ester/triacylglycerol synthase family O-acyltransferase [Solirubrobacteraceae bacterium]
MAEALSASDRSSLAAEQGSVNMAVGGVLIFDRGPGIDRAGVLERVSSRLHLMPRLRQRLEAPALGLANPVWVDDRDFDIDWHIRSTSLPAPGGDDELSALVGRESSRLMDRSRPLWEMTVVDGLARGRTRTAVRLHHALVDGVAALALGMLLVDPTPEPLDITPPEEEWSPRPFALRRHLARLAATPLSQAQKLMLEGASRALDPDPRRAAGELRRATELLTELARNRPQAPMTPLNKPISANRRWTLVRADLALIKACARQSDATVNDVILGAVAGMLRSYLQGSDWDGRPPVALVPVSVRRDEHGELGNRISTVLVDLPADLEDAHERVRAVRSGWRLLKESAGGRAGALRVGASGAAPPLVSAMLARAMSGVLAFNLVVSNIPGPQQPLYMNGSRVRAVYPVVPLNPSNQGLSVGVFSYDGGVYFGLLADRALQPPLAVCAAALQDTLDELLPGARR